MIAIALHHGTRQQRLRAAASRRRRHARTTTSRCPTCSLHYFPTGLLGLGLTALMAIFMSGMAGNVTAFNTVWTYDIYQAYIRPGASRPALPLDGPRRHRFGIAAQRRRGVRGHAVQQHHGHAPAGVRVRERAAVRDLPAGDVLAPGDRARRLLRAAGRDRGGGAAPRAHPAARLAAGLKGGFLGSVLSIYPARWRRTSGPRSSPGPPASWPRSSSSLLTERRKSDAELTGLVYALTPRIRGRRPGLVPPSRPARRGSARAGAGAQPPVLVRSR